MVEINGSDILGSSQGEENHHNKGKQAESVKSFISKILNSFHQADKTTKLVLILAAIFSLGLIYKIGTIVMESDSKVDFSVRKMDEIYSQTPKFDENSDAYKAWQEFETLTVEKIIERSEKTETKLENDENSPIYTKVKTEGDYTFSGMFSGTYKGQMKLTGDGPHDWLAHGFGSLIFNQDRADWQDDFSQNQNLALAQKYPKDYGQRIIEGYFSHGILTGYGKYVWGSGSIYLGDFLDGKRHGQGQYKDQNAVMYKGEFKHGFKNGQGLLSFPNGKKYEGDFKDDMKHGKGVLIYKDGKHYTGDFKNDRVDGQGTLHQVNGTVKTGQFKENDKGRIIEKWITKG